jgi:HSP20 family protein
MTTLMTNLCHPSHMDQFFNQLWRSDFGKSTSCATTDQVPLRPRVNVYETDTHYVLEADLPGVDKKDLSIEVENGILSIRADRKLDESDDLQVLRRERSASALFVRQFTLGDEIDTDKIDAKLRDGVLRLNVPKTERALPRRISVE